MPCKPVYYEHFGVVCDPYCLCQYIDGVVDIRGIKWPMTRRVPRLFSSKIQDRCPGAHWVTVDKVTIQQSHFSTELCPHLHIQKHKAIDTF